MKGKKQHSIGSAQDLDESILREIERNPEMMQAVMEKMVGRALQEMSSTAALPSSPEKMQEMVEEVVERAMRKMSSSVRHALSSLAGSDDCDLEISVDIAYDDDDDEGEEGEEIEEIEEGEYYENEEEEEEGGHEKNNNKNSNNDNKKRSNAHKRKTHVPECVCTCCPRIRPSKGSKGAALLASDVWRCVEQMCVDDVEREQLAQQYEHYARSLHTSTSTSTSTRSQTYTSTQEATSVTATVTETRAAIRIKPPKSTPCLTFPCPSSSAKQRREQNKANNNKKNANSSALSAPPLPVIDAGTQFIINRCYNSLAQHRRNDRLVIPILSHLRDYLLRCANRKSITLYLSHIASEIAHRQREREKRLERSQSHARSQSSQHTQSHSQSYKKAKKAETSPTMDEEVMLRALKKFIKQFARFSTSCPHLLSVTEPGRDDDNDDIRENNDNNMVVTEGETVGIASEREGEKEGEIQETNCES